MKPDLLLRQPMITELTLTCIVHSDQIHHPFTSETSVFLRVTLAMFLEEKMFIDLQFACIVSQNLFLFIKQAVCSGELN